MFDKPLVPESTPPAPARPIPPCNCDVDPIEGLKQLFVDYVQGQALAAGRDPATRPVFQRLHGVVHGTFIIRPDLPEDLYIGLFGQKSEYPAWVRFSSDVQPGVPDLKGTIGVGIKLFGVDGPKIMDPDRDATTHDFIVQNHDVLFVDTAKDMCEFTCSGLNGKFQEYVEAHPITGQILSDMKKVVESVLVTPYWSVLPFQFGDNRYVKYKLEPESAVGGGSITNFDDPFYLRADLHSRLKVGEARFRFLVQFQTNEQEMPLDRATVRWNEQASPPIHVATLVLPQQDLDARNQSLYGENLAFNTWHALAEHKPVGTLAEARKVVYRASAQVRRDFNATPLGEPVEPRPAEWVPGVAYPPARDTMIVRAEIHPAIGIARVGNSPNEYVIGPEIIDPPPKKPGAYRDGNGAIKRQAAQFRIFGYNAAGEVVRELTADWADIQWSVHVANRKAAWYQWSMALDVPEAAGTSVPLRNATVMGAQRAQLAIDPGPKSIKGKSTKGADYELRGTFQTTPVYLGEVQTDDHGRLIFLGGHGVSASPTGAPILPPGDNGFINADGWYDDMSDGPVTAEVSIEGRKIPVEPAWVVTAPPNYGPDLVGVRTLYDLLYDLYIQGGWFSFPAKISFRNDIYPILRRLSDLQWVNSGFATQFGRGSSSDFHDPDYIAKLARDPKADGYDLYAELRLQVFHSFRNPNGLDNNQLPWPWIYGDAMQIVPANTPRQNASVSNTQYSILQTWANGDFTPDWGVPLKKPTALEDLPMSEQPAMLDRAALEFCLADAFHPGCEVTWPVRHLSLYTKPFRIRQRPATEPEPDFGPILTPEIALSSTGPLNAQGPGDLTRWMGLPWQADTGFCRAGYKDRSTGYHYDPFLPTFWPARVPNQVLTEPNYKIVVDETQPRERRLEAFTKRMMWAEDALHGNIPGQMADMVRIFGDMGLVEVRDGVHGDPVFPETMMVASFGPGVTPPPLPGTPTVAAHAEEGPRAVPHEALAQPIAMEDQLPIPVRYPKGK